ncbi:YtrH family sporulation protein [Tepidibacillus fermentans]|uniref:Sporulation protein YtrH n=1 Tax=Tepidibacillus fermentans TaxID=1281767 RepID=A0A4R3KJF0_9BACI|nr:YtrH family sporulation protein [Tepidibacillus fermentans]TCS83589.1 sporulation protein YtrH [Tepidibacillus fermentans]
MGTFITNLIMSFLLAFGVVIGGSLFGGIGAFLTHQPPILTIKQLSNDLKIWALVVSLGGTFDSFKTFESGLFDGNLSGMIRQLLMIITGLAGAYSGRIAILWLIKGDIE